jgi:hypothetical protein
MVYNASPPYEILRNKLLDFPTMQHLRRFARCWDLTANSGNFLETTPLLWSGQQSPFDAFMKWSEWLYGQAGRQHGIALARLAELLFDYLTGLLNQAPAMVAQSLWRDWRRAGRREKPEFLTPYIAEERERTPRRVPPGPKRQSRHLAPAEARAKSDVAQASG